MKTESNRESVEALKNMLSEVDGLLSTTEPLPENRTARCRELLVAAIALADDLQRQEGAATASTLGHKGGSATAKRHGAEHFRQMAAARKSFKGGRPRKESKIPT